MKTVGIVAEYNPFHNGHKYHIDESRRITGAENIIVVMSGNFVQRGEPAVFDKWLRAEAAVRNGADLVLELPAVFSSSSAEYFARGAMGILTGLGIVEGVSFGAEENSLEKLQNAADIFSNESDEFKAIIKENLKQGMSFASARSKAADKTGLSDLSEIINKPNNILAIEYLKQLNQMKKNPCYKDRVLPRPILISRKSSGYYDENFEDNIAGAGKLRELLMDGRDISNYIPDMGFITASENCSNETLENRFSPCFPDSMYELLIYKLISTSSKELSEIDGVVEGLENRGKKAARESIDYESLINLIKSKRYSRTAIQRMLTRILLGIKKTDMREFMEANRTYSKVLAFNEKGATLIREIKKKNKDDERVKIITNINREGPDNPVLKKMLEYDIKASDIYDILNYGRVGVRSEYRVNPKAVCLEKNR